jgi:tetratricopeptide (TPR) repeat protein
MTLRMYKSEIILVLVTLGVVFLMIFLNDINRQIRIRELRLYMQESNREDNNSDHIGLLMKYKLQKKIYENQMSQDDADIIEARVNSILARNAINEDVSMDRYTYLSIPSLYMINFFRRMTNKDPIRNARDDPANLYLSMGYYYERNNYFSKALEFYGKALKEEKYTSNAIASIILHEGYCNSILGNYQTARNKYLNIINNYSDKPVAITALVLLRYIEGFKSEVDRIVKNERDSVEKSEKLTKLIAYRDALSVVTKIENKTTPQDRAKVKYIKGKCLEGLSEKEKAIDTYQNIVTTEAASQYARLANRRIYIAGSLASNGEKVKNMAMNNNRTIKDPVLDKMVDQETKLRGPEKPIQDDIFQKELVKEESRNPVLNVEKLEATAKMEAPKPVQKVEKLEAPAKIEPPKPVIQDKKQPAPKPVTFRVNTIEGNIFIGVIQQETGEFVRLGTMIGPVTIPRNKIVSIERVKEEP